MIMNKESLVSANIGHDIVDILHTVSKNLLIIALYESNGNTLITKA